MLRDESGYAQASWFNGAYLARVFKRGQRLVLHGRVTRFKGAIVIQQPDYELIESGEDDRLHTGRLVPVYSLTEGLAQRALRSLMWRIVDTFAREVPEALLTQSERGVSSSRSHRRSATATSPRPTRRSTPRATDSRSTTSCC